MRLWRAGMCASPCMPFHARLAGQLQAHSCDADLRLCDQLACMHGAQTVKVSKELATSRPTRACCLSPRRTWPMLGKRTAARPASSRALRTTAPSVMPSCLAKRVTSIVKRAVNWARWQEMRALLQLCANFKHSNTFAQHLNHKLQHSNAMNCMPARDAYSFC